MTEAEVQVTYRKYDGSLHWHQPMRRLGQDAHGVWLGASAGMVARKGKDGPPVVVEHPHVMLFPPAAWWTVVFNGPPAPVEIYADITTPPEWPHYGEVTMIDLDLDVLRRRSDDTAVIVDQDEFAEHRIRYGYPQDVIEAAESAASWLHAALADGTQPFAGEYQRWLTMIT